MKTPQKRKRSKSPTTSLERSIPERPPFTFTSCSIASDSHPERNEDNFIAEQRRGLVAVFDGVGGSTAGEIASQIAGYVIRRGWKRIFQQQQPESPSTLLEHCESVDLRSTLLHLVQEAHEYIRTQALGDPQPLVVHIDQISIGPGDRILLCTDGIHDNLTDREIEEIVRRGARSTAARVLVEHAVQRSRQASSTTMRAKPDDMSAVVVTCNR